MRTRDEARRNPDRTVHAVGPDGLEEVVRYDRSGKYRIESWSADGSSVSAAATSLTWAVRTAQRWARTGGKVHLGRAGGTRFDAEYLRPIRGPRP